MKKIISAVAMLFTTVILTGQTLFPTKDEIKQFSVSKTCVVLEDDPFSSYNAFIKKAVKAFWKITPYEFIDASEFNTRRKNPEYSFIVLTQTNFIRDKANTLYNFINLLQGKKVSKVEEMPEVCAIPLSFAGEDDLEYGFKLGAILSFMQKHAQAIMADPSSTGRKYLKFYNKNIPEIVNKTILIKQEDLVPEIATIDKIKAIYKNKVEIVAEEDIVKAIENKTPNTLILHKVGPVDGKNAGYCFKMLIGCDDSDMYYYHHHLIEKDNPNGLLPADLRRLAK
ncbi:MAG: hypothetical protein LLG13_08815 [Bacteroidales bacterium]|nr:hypothetical protein [Bacteroidales bacterium]